MLGDRWTLLIMRDLVVGPRRFNDLRANVVGIPPNILSQRLKALTDHGLVTTRELPRPAARTVYAATDKGMSVLPILRELVRFGVPLLGPADACSALPWPANVVSTALTAFLTADADVPNECYEVVVDGERFVLASTRTAVHRDADDNPPVLTMSIPGWVLMNLRTGHTSWDDAVNAGLLAVSGPKRSVSNFRKAFRLTS